MTKKDLGLLAGVLVFSVILSLIIANFVFGSSGERQEKVEVVDPISADFPVSQVSPKYFNNKSVDPTQLIQIGNPNEHPFAGGNNGQ